MPDSNDQLVLWDQTEDLCAEPVENPVLARAAPLRRVPTLLACEDAAVQAAWARGRRAGLWQSLSTRTGRLQAHALRSLKRLIAQTRQHEFFEARQTVEDLLGLLAAAAERDRARD